MDIQLNAKDYIEELKEDLEKATNYLKQEFLNIRAGRANPHILDKIMVDYYGVSTPLSQMSNISAPEARLLTVSLWDVSAMKNVTKAILESDLGINPTDDGKIIRLVFPMLTEERRKDLVKSARQICENTKVNMRNARRDAMDALKNMKKENTISEDECSGYEKEVQKILDGYIVNTDKLLSEKEKEIMEI